MPFTYEEKYFVEIPMQDKGWGGKQICSEYHQKKWSVSSFTDLLRKIDNTVQLNKKVAMDDHGLSKCNGIFSVFLT